MFNLRQATASAFGQIVTKIGMMIAYTAKYLFPVIYWAARILDTNLHKNYYKGPP